MQHLECGGSHQTPVWLSRGAWRIKLFSRYRPVTFVALKCYCLQQPTAVGDVIHFFVSTPILAVGDSCTKPRAISTFLTHNETITVHTFPTGSGSPSCFTCGSLWCTISREGCNFHGMSQFSLIQSNISRF